MPCPVIGLYVTSIVDLAGLLFTTFLGLISTMLWSLGFPFLSGSLSSRGFTAGTSVEVLLQEAI